jgi:hypothetical protein
MMEEHACRAPTSRRLGLQEALTWLVAHFQSFYVTTAGASRLQNATVLNSSRFSAVVAIDTRELPAVGAVVTAYYMPFRRNGNSYGEQVTYLTNADAPKVTAATATWRREVKAAAAAGQVPYVDASTCTYQARSPFDAYTELERTATEDEIAGMLTSSPAQAMGDVLLFPEPRERQIRMTWRHPQTPTLPDLPHSWTVTGPALALAAGTFGKGEFATFQLGLFAAKGGLAGVRVDPAVGSAGFIAGDGSSIAQRALNCFNLEGVDNRGTVRCPLVLYSLSWILSAVSHGFCC